jgi:biotin carboxyl carrier protein
MKKYVLEIGDKEYKAELKEFTKDFADIEVNGILYHVKLKELGRTDLGFPEIKTVQPLEPLKPGPVFQLNSTAAPARPSGGVGGAAEGVRAPMPGLILDILIQEGAPVKAGQNIILMEAMKMENQVPAPHDGTINKIYVKKGDSVEEDQLLIEISRSALTII